MQYSDEKYASLYILSTLNEILSIRRMENDNSAMFSIEIVGVMLIHIPRPIFHRMFQRPSICHFKTVFQKYFFEFWIEPIPIDCEAFSWNNFEQVCKPFNGKMLISRLESSLLVSEDAINIFIGIKRFYIFMS